MPYHSRILDADRPLTPQSGISTPESGSPTPRSGLSTPTSVEEIVSIAMQRYLNEGPGEQSALYKRSDNGALSTSRACICVEREYVDSGNV